MVSTPTTRNKFRKQGTGDNQDAWGVELNEDALDRIDTALDGLEVVNVAGSTNVTLTTTNYEANQYRNRILELTGDVTSDISVIVPALQKWWYVVDSTNTSNTITVQTSGGNGVALRNGETNLLYCDASDVLDFGFATTDYTLEQIDTIGPTLLSGNSTSTVQLSTGTKTFTIAGANTKAFAPGVLVRAAVSTSPNDNYLIGSVNTYTHPTLTVDVDEVQGSGNSSSWQISFTGESAVANAAANAASAAAIAAANYKGDWSDLSGALNIPASVGHISRVWLLKTNLADVTASEPSYSSPDWDQIIPIATNGAVAGALTFSDTVTFENTTDFEGVANFENDVILGGALDITITADTVGGTLSDDYLHLIDGGLAVTLPGAVAGKRLKVIGNWGDTVVSADNAITITGGSGDSIIAGEDSIDTAVELDTRGEFEFIAIDGDRWVFTR